jgi:hypothetical protein
MTADNEVELVPVNPVLHPPSDACLRYMTTHGLSRSSDRPPRPSTTTTGVLTRRDLVMTFLRYTL